MDFKGTMFSWLPAIALSPNFSPAIKHGSSQRPAWPSALASLLNDHIQFQSFKYGPCAKDLQMGILLGVHARYSTACSTYILVASQLWKVISCFSPTGSSLCVLHVRIQNLNQKLRVDISYSLHLTTFNQLSNSVHFCLLISPESIHFTSLQKLHCFLLRNHMMSLLISI